MSEAKRRLAAILAADVVGYSRLMGADEDATVATLEVCRGIFRDTVAAGAGRIVDTAGDSVLSVFDSVVEAVRAAIAIQALLAAHNERLSDDRKMAFRIGINLGDVIAKPDGTIYGDGVNVAARLEALAEPGGVTISGSAFEQIEGKVDAPFVFAGEQSVKNIERPIRTYRLGGAGGGDGSDAKAVDKPVPSIPDKPSIAILPFDNMSGDADQGFFADGITEDVITELARYPDLFVIARNSSFTYKGRAVKIQDVAADLGVRYVVEGSVRKAGDRVRVSVQLIECETGAHLWAERYDRELTDIFEIQDELTQAICATLPGRIRPAEEARLARKPPADMAALDCLLAGRIHHHRLTKEDNAEALRMLDRAIELDPAFAQAYAWKACVLGQSMQFGFADGNVLDEALSALNQAISLDESDVECHRLLCEVAMEQRDLAQAGIHNERALSLNPNDPRLVAQKGELLTWRGEGDAGAEWVETAMRLDPHGAPGRAHLLGRAHYTARRHDDAVAAYGAITAPNLRAHAGMAAAQAQAGDTAAAARHAAAVLELKPDFSAADYAGGMPYENEDDRAHLVEGLVKAGLPG